MAGCASSKSGDVYTRDQARIEMYVRIGAVAGGLAGSAVEENVTKKNALEITVKLDSGKMIAVVQEMGENFYPGERVRVLSNDGATRVTY